MLYTESIIYLLSLVSMKEWQPTYTRFSRNERAGILALLILLLVIASGRLLFRYNSPQSSGQMSENKLKEQWEAKSRANIMQQVNNTALIDLNTADSIMLLSLDGVGPAITHRILNRRREQGTFKNYGQLWQLYHFNSNTKDEILRKTTIGK